MRRTQFTILSALASTLSLALLPGSVGTAAAASTSGPGSDPILFVHGYNSSGATWNTMASRFQADGWPASHLRQWSYNTAQSNATTAQQLAQEVDMLKAATGDR